MHLVVMPFSPTFRHLIPLRPKYSALQTVLRYPQSMFLSHPYRTKGKIIVLYIITFTFFDSRPEHRGFWTDWQQTLPEYNLLLLSF
jgi:hypothetical protein